MIMQKILIISWLLNCSKLLLLSDIRSSPSEKKTPAEMSFEYFVDRKICIYYNIYNLTGKAIDATDELIGRKTLSLLGENFG